MGEGYRGGKGKIKGEGFSRNHLQHLHLTSYASFAAAVAATSLFFFLPEFREVKSNFLLSFIFVKKT